MARAEKNIKPLIVNLNELAEREGDVSFQKSEDVNPLALLAWTLLFCLWSLPFFFGGRGDFSNSVVKCVFYAAIFGSLIFSFRKKLMAKNESSPSFSAKTFLLFVPLFVYLLFQVVPLPMGLVSLISSNTALAYQKVNSDFAFLSLDPSASLSAFSWLFLFVALYALLLEVPYVARSIKAQHSSRSRKSKTVFFSPVSRQYDEFSEVIHSVLIKVSLLCAVIGVTHLVLQLPALFGIFSFREDFQVTWRAHWPFVNANQLAVMLEVGLMLSCVNFLRERQLKMLSLTHHEDRGLLKSIEALFYSFEKQVLSLGIMLILAIGLVLTMSRAGIILAFLGMTALWIFYKSNPIVMISPIGFVSKTGAGNSTKKEFIKTLCKNLLPPIMIGILVFSFIGEDSTYDLSSRVDETFNPNASAPRSTINKITWNILSRNSIFGVGLNSWASSASEFSTGDTIGWKLDYAHNDYFQLISEIGLLGTTLLLAPILCGMRVFFRLNLSFLAPVQKVYLFGSFLAFLVPALHAVVDFPYHLPLLSLSIGSAFLAFFAISFVFARGKPCVNVIRN